MILHDYEVKPLKVSELKKGDKFLLYQSLNGDNLPVFVVTEVSSHAVDVVNIDLGKTYIFGKNVLVVPVTVEFSVCPVKEVIVSDLRCKWGVTDD